ncbi:MAG TPA: hypothetical protein VFD45_01230 [Patescibacteria group bacterium]|nr:hypothetical protein [Patescibacteria group bacterium]
MVENVGSIDRGDYFSKHRSEPLLGQILSPEELTVGRRIIINKEGRDGATVEVVRGVYSLESVPGKWVKVKGEQDDEPFFLAISLADYGVVPYEGSGLWNTFTCLRDPKILLGGIPDNVVEFKPRNKGR